MREINPVYLVSSRQRKLLLRGLKMSDFDWSKLITDVVSKQVDKIYKGVKDFTQDQFDSIKIELGTAFKNYLTNSVNKYSKMKTIIYKKEAVSLDKFYINLDLQFKKSFDEIEQIKTDTISDLDKMGKFLILRGSAGMGKSTLMKHLFLSVIKESSQIPIFFELKDVNGSSEDLINCLYKSMVNLGFNLKIEYFLKALSYGKFVIFLDGFDEIENDKRMNISKSISEISDKYLDNSIILSSRESKEFRSWVKFIELDIKSLEMEQAVQLISKLDYEIIIKDRFISDLGTHLFKENESFASNPLLLTIMFMTYHQYAEIPEKKHEFYEAAFDVLYSKHDATKGLVRDRFTKISSSDFRKILYIISTASYLEDKLSFSDNKLIEYISQAKSLQNKSFDEDDYKEDLVKSVCILIEDDLKYYFIHRSFQEYFTAKYVESASEEDRKTILHTIYKIKPRSINQDVVFATLFDLNRSILERYLFTDYIDEIMRSTSAETLEEQRFKYICLLYSRICLDYTMIGNQEGVDTEEDAISFTHKNSTSSLREIIDFIIGKYPSIIPKEGYTPSESESIEIMKTYGEDSYGNGVSFYVYFENVEIGSDIFWFILRQAEFITRDFDYIVRISDELKKMNSSFSTIKDTLFNVSARKEKS